MEELAIIGEYFPRGGVFLDIGANVANHSVFIAKFYHPSQVIVIEPNPAAIPILKANVSLNDLAHLVDATHLGVGLSDTPASGDAGGPRLVRGDELFQRRRIDFIRIDVGGIEMRALAGMAGTIVRWRPPIFIAVANANAAAFKAWVKRNGYVIDRSFQRDPANENLMLVPACR